MGNEKGKRDWGCLQERLRGHRMVKETRRQGLSLKYTLLEMIIMWSNFIYELRTEWLCTCVCPWLRIICPRVKSNCSLDSWVGEGVGELKHLWGWIGYGEDSFGEIWKCHSQQWIGRLRSLWRGFQLMMGTRLCSLLGILLSWPAGWMMFPWEEN